MLGLVEVDRDVPRNPGDTSDHGARARSATAKEILVVWVPDELFMRMSSEDQQSYLLVEGRPTGTPTEEDGEYCWCRGLRVLKCSLGREGGAIPLNMRADSLRLRVCFGPRAEGREVCLLHPGHQHLQHLSLSCELGQALVRLAAYIAQPSLSHWYGSATFK